MEVTLHSRHCKLCYLTRPTGLNCRLTLAGCLLYYKAIATRHLNEVIQGNLIKGNQAGNPESPRIAK
jgi:hypothetical protein